MTATATPYRVVDRDNYGWYQLAGRGLYQTSRGQRLGLGDHLAYADLETSRGPLRPVLPISDADEVLLADTMGWLGHRTVATLAAAIELVFHRLREHPRDGTTQGLAAIESSDYAMRTLTAGREGSNESELLRAVVWIGNAFNLDKHRRGMSNDTASLRARGPVSRRRVDVDGRKILADMIYRWVTDPDRYTEVAETLAGEVARFADRQGQNGWVSIADQWLRPGTLAKTDARTCYQLFYSKSSNFDPDAFE